MNKKKEKIVDSLMNTITNTFNENKEAFVLGVKTTIPDHFLEEKENLIEYVKKNKSTFFESPFNEVDGLVFAQASYFKCEKTVGYFGENKPWVTFEAFNIPGDLDYLVSEMFWPEGNKIFFEELCKSPRFKEVLLNHYVDIYEKKSEKQFSATSYKIPTGEIVVAYRGTDATMVGWKEDINMTYTFPVPSQVSAKEYIDYIHNETKDTKESLIIVGHSKGGNLASYAFLFSEDEAKNRVAKTYNYDGPGFMPDSLEEEKYNEYEAKVIKIIPEESIVGLFLENQGNVKIIKSTSVALLQHNALTWLSSNNQFIEIVKHNRNATRLCGTLNRWIFSMEAEQRETVFEALFTIINGTKTRTVPEFLDSITKDSGIIRATMISISDEDAECVKKMLSELVLVALKISSRARKTEELS